VSTRRNATSAGRTSFSSGCSDGLAFNGARRVALGSDELVRLLGLVRSGPVPIRASPAQRRQNSRVLEPEFGRLLEEKLAHVVREMSTLRPAWMRRAACRGWDTRMWFPERSEADLARTAKRICASCPVKIECDDFASRFSETDCIGIWSGMNSRERRRTRRNVA
jgi:hypothetical protein